MSFGDRLGRLRKQKRINQSELANRVGVTQQTISGYEKGKNKPSIDTLQRIAEVLEVSSCYLLEGSVVGNGLELTKEQKSMLELYEMISDDQRELVKGLLISLANKDENEEQ